jgi:hypothetical protein
MAGMDIAGMWRSMRTDPAGAPRPGVHLEAAAEGITITVAQQCQVALPLRSMSADEVTVTVTSHRPGVAAQVSVGANLNSADGSFQGPTTTVGQGQFTATDPQVRVSFVVLPAQPVLGVGAEATWADGAAQSIALTYVEHECNLSPWWRWLIQALDFLTSLFFMARSRMTQ